MRGILAAGRLFCAAWLQTHGRDECSPVAPGAGAAPARSATWRATDVVGICAEGPLRATLEGCPARTMRGVST